MVRSTVSGYWRDHPRSNTARRIQSFNRYKRFEAMVKKVGLPYHSPHKFRHGHAVCAIKLAKDITELKAISQNLMHRNLSITDGIYGILSDRDIKAKITLLGNNSENDFDLLVDKIVRRLKQQSLDREI
jgi:integrase